MVEVVRREVCLVAPRDVAQGDVVGVAARGVDQLDQSRGLARSQPALEGRHDRRVAGRTPHAQPSRRRLGVIVSGSERMGHGLVVRAQVEERRDLELHLRASAGDATLATADLRWDLAALKILVEEAGGRFTDQTGRDTAAGGSALATRAIVWPSTGGALIYV